MASFVTDPKKVILESFSDTKISFRYFFFYKASADTHIPSLLSQLYCQPIGGHVLAHAVHTRLSVRRSRGEERIVKVSVYVPEK